MFEKLAAFWAYITGPDPEEVEILRTEREREILWRQVDRLETEIERLRQPAFPGSEQPGCQPSPHGSPGRWISALPIPCCR